MGQIETQLPSPKGAQGDKVKLCNVEVIPNKECMPKHKLLVMDMWFNTTNDSI